MQLTKCIPWLSDTKDVITMLKRRISTILVIMVQQGHGKCDRIGLLPYQDNVYLFIRDGDDDNISLGLFICIRY